MKFGILPYLRVVATTRCNNRCPYCHHEGEVPGKFPAASLSTDAMNHCLRVLAAAGVQKLKFVGGEPFLCTDLPEWIRTFREAAPESDISVITAGVARLKTLDRAVNAGLDRINVSIHGFGIEAFRQRTRCSSNYRIRQAFLNGLLERGMRPKLNYVFTGDSDLSDLEALFSFAAMRGTVVNVLDDLGGDLSSEDIRAAVERIWGIAPMERIDDDPCSLPTTHLCYSDGLVVEIKHSRLSERSPYGFCTDCPLQKRCREGILATRLTSDGRLVPCMDRPDLGVSLIEMMKDQGEAETIMKLRMNRSAA